MPITQAPIIIQQAVPDRSSATFVIILRDETEALLVPSSITWSLFNGLGEIINDRDTVPITPTDSTVTIVTYGEDNNYDDGARRYLLVEAVYSSSSGSNLPFRNEIVYPIARLVD